MIMPSTKSLLLGICVLILTGGALQAQNADNPKLHFVKGPTKVHLGSVAQIDVPVGFVFLDAKNYRAMLKSEGEPVSGDEVGWLSATNEDWAVAFDFSDVGYVKDDDKDQLEHPEKLLSRIKEGNDEANKTRAKAGNPTIENVGWEIPPKYDAETHNLEWAIRCTVEGKPLLNYNTRLLGRKGVMEVVLICEPAQLQETLPKFRSLLTGYSYQSGQSYAEYRPGDKIAKYGLGALVVGGAAVGAAKLGLFAWVAVLFKKAWKLVVILFAAIASFFKKLFGRKNTAEQ
jgi:uncharacterized membrane-anchored protein